MLVTRVSWTRLSKEQRKRQYMGNTDGANSRIKIKQTKEDDTGAVARDLPSECEDSAVL